MVDFKTRIFTESDNDIIGAEVIVFSDQGTRIGSIEIANAEDLNALREQLEVIDETYFDETRLNAVLANSQESTTINATSISGYSSSDLAKVSQLSGYALTNHTHVKTSITDLYNYSISCSNYNPTIDTDISVTVKVTNQAGNPVVGHTVSILKNNSSWKSGTTGSNGEFTTTYTCSEWGLITFSANNTNTQINVQAIQVQYIQTTSKSCASLYSEDFTATVKAKPTGYEYMFVPINSYRSVTRMTGLSGTTASFQVSNISSSTRDVNAVGWLIYYPNNFNI